MAIGADGRFDEATRARMRAIFRPAGTYLDTPTYGLASGEVLATMQDALSAWQRGTATTAGYDQAVARSRTLFADLVGVDAEQVAVANQVSVLVGTVAASLPAGSRVVAVEGDFTSLLYPFLVHRDRGVEVRMVGLDALPDALEDGTDLVAFSLVQSADGRVADLEAVLAAAERHGARTLVDATHAVGWLPVDASRIDHLVVGAYKWLMAPRGTAFLTVGDDALASLRPIAAGWYAGEDVWGSIYGPSMDLARSARRLDVSPAWLSWVGTVPALALVHDLGVEAIHRHDTTLAATMRAALDLPEPDRPSAIVSVPDVEGVDLAAAGIRASVRAGRLRVGFHLHNDLEDVERVVEALRR